MLLIGHKIDEIRELRGINKSQLARKIDRTRATTEDILLRESIDTSLLITISKALNYNFLLWLALNSGLPVDVKEDYGKIPVTKITEEEKNEWKDKYLNTIEKLAMVQEENASYLKKQQLVK
jgi:transcriptional regulator with XRE-family HTH domain